MKLYKLKYLYLLIIVFLQLSCNASSDSPGSLTAGALYVSQKLGVDSNERGEKDKPYKTISYALSNIKEEKSIYVEGGIYDIKNGENFPFILKKGVSINKGEGKKNSEKVIIKGFGIGENKKLISIILNGDNKLNSIEINSMNNIGVLSIKGDNKVLNSSFINNSSAIGVINNSKITLINTSISDSSHVGIEATGNAMLILLSSKIYNNKIGVFISDNASINFEDNNLSKGNEITGNTQCDFFHEGQKNIKLREIKWDQDVFEFSIKKECENGNNIVNIGSASIDYQTTPLHGVTLFSTDKIINITAPEFGSTIFSNNPLFIYNTSGNNLVMIAIWDHLPVVRNRKIINSEDIVWYWHTGMKNSPIGYVNFNKGRSPIDGNLNPKKISDIPPNLLENGRSYYFSVWEWDNEGLKIISSSNVSYFITAP